MEKKKGIKLAVLAVATIACLALAMMAPFEGLDANGMRFLAVFIWWIVMMVLELVPTHVSSLIACTLCLLFGIGDTSQVFGQFGSSTVLLLLGAFGMAAGLSNSGILKRIALLMVKCAPKNYVGQMIVFELANTIVTPWVPAAAAKQAIMVPIANDVATQLGFKPHTRPYSGFFAIIVIASLIFGSCFLTGNGSVAIALGFMPDGVSWLDWARNALVYFIVSLVLFTVFFILWHRPKKGEAEGGDPEAILVSCNKQLAEMGPLRGKELFALVVLILAIVGFIGGSSVGISSHAVALTAWLLLCVSGCFKPQDFSTRLMWPIVIMIGCILGMVTLLSATGVAAWIAQLCAPVIIPLAEQPLLLVLLLAILMILLRFAMVSATVMMALVSTMLAATSIHPFVYLFVVTVSGMSFLLYYQNPTVIGALGMTDGKVVQKDIYATGIAFIVINLIAIAVSVPYWQVLGLLG